MKKLLFIFTIIASTLLSSCNNSNCEITYSSSSCITLDNIEDWGAEIKSHEFNNGLGKITFKGKVTNVPESAFRGCTSLKSITLPNSVTSIGDLAFQYCESLASVTIPDSVTSIGDLAFWNCSSLTSITIPNSVTSIGDYAFHFCTSLKSVTIPDSVTLIGEETFFDCIWLESVYCKATTPPTVGSNVFSTDYFIPYGSGPIGCKIYVPRKSVKAYKSAEGWKEYANYIVGYDF